MAGMSDALKNSLLDVVFNGGSYTPPTHYYVGLYQGDPDDAGTELSGVGYARVLHDDWNDAAVGQVDNEGVVQFPTPTAEWAPSDDMATHFGIFAALTGGTPIWSGALTTAQAIGIGNDVEFADGALVASL